MVLVVIFLILGLPILTCGAIHPTTFNIVDMAVLLLFASNDRNISRKEGIIFLVVFLLYYTNLFLA